MTIEGRWGYDGADDWEPEPPRRQQQPDEALSASDRSGAVTVAVAKDATVATVVAVRLAPGWRGMIGARGLGAAVAEAVTAATVVAMAAAAQQSPPEPETPPARRFAGSEPIRPAEALRLLRDALREIEAFADTADAQVRRVGTAESGGGHVRATARAGRTVSVDVDLPWAARSRDGEIEAELADAVRAAHRRSVLPDPPPGSATAELRALTLDPAALVRRLGVAS